MSEFVRGGSRNSRASVGDFPVGRFSNGNSPRVYVVGRNSNRQMMTGNTELISTNPPDLIDAGS